MKFTKSNTDKAAKQPKAPLSSKSKFKNKNAAVTNVKLQKGTKLVADLLKKNSLGEDVKGTVKEIKPLKGNKKPLVKPSPEVQLGLKLDKLLEKKVKKQVNSFEETPVKSSPDKTQSSESSQSNPSPKKKRKRGKKNKKSLNGSQTTLTSSDELIKESSSSEAKSGKKSKSAGKKNAGPVKKDDTISSELSQEEKDTPDSEYSLVPKDVLKAVKSLLEIFMKKNTTKLLDSEPSPIFLKFLFYLPHNKPKIIRFNLPHSLVWDTSDICLFVTDIVKKNAEESKSKWEEMLRDENVNNITEVIPLKSLLMDYRQYQDKRKLSDRFDYFMVEGKIAHRVVGILGNKFFSSKRKTPFPVKLEKGKMEVAIKQALTRTVAQYTPAAETFTIQVGHTGMSAKEIQNNILKVWEQYPEQFCVYWQNINRASIFIHEIKDMPIFCNLVPPEGGKPAAYKNMKWDKSSNVPVIGELSTQLDKKVLVYPSGKILVKEDPKPKANEESILAKKLKKKEKRKLKKLKRRQSNSDGTGKEDDEELESDDDLGGRKDMLESDSDEELQFEEPSSDEEEERPTKKQKPAVKKDLTIKASKEKKKKKDKKKAVTNDDDSDSDLVDKAEEMYLQDLALEMKKSQKASQKAASKEPKSKGSDTKADDSSESDDGGGWLKEQSMEEDSESEEDIPTLVPAPKSNKAGKINRGKKVNGVTAVSPQAKKKKAQKKTGSQKNTLKAEPIQSKKNAKKTASAVSEKQDLSSKKKSPDLSFQGVKADQKKSKPKKQNQTKNKIMKKKLSK